MSQWGVECEELPSMTKKSVYNYKLPVNILSQKCVCVCALALVLRCTYWGQRTTRGDLVLSVHQMPLCPSFQHCVTGNDGSRSSHCAASGLATPSVHQESLSAAASGSWPGKTAFHTIPRSLVQGHLVWTPMNKYRKFGGFPTLLFVGFLGSMHIFDKISLGITVIIT